MSRRRTFDAAVVALAVMLVSACSAGAGKTGAKPTTTPATVPVTPTRSVTVQPALLAGPNATTAAAPIEVTMRPSASGKLVVDFDEHAVGATRAQWEAAAWNATIVASMITGAPLSGRELHFSVTGPVVGQSVGALLTVAVIALLRGDRLEPDITLTGAINPDGTIGPVPGVPESVAAAVRAHKARMLVPIGERNAADASGKVVDVVAAGPRVGIRVVETPDVYEAYQLFTGKVLPQPPASDKTALNRDVYHALSTKTDAWTKQFVAARSQFRSLAPSVQQDLNPYAAAAQRQQQQARTLSDDGKDAGAFSATVNAAALMQAIAQAGTSLPILLSQGVAPFVRAITSGRQLATAITAVAGKLADVSPKSVTDASALLAAYGNVIDAASLSQYAQHLFAAKDATGQADLSQVAEGAVYYGLAGSLVDASSDLVSVVRDAGGATLAPHIDVPATADAFLGAAQANLAEFQSLVVAPRAFAGKTDVSAASDAIAQSDTVFALARNGGGVLGDLPQLLGTRAPSAYATLAGAVSTYVRSAALLAKYTSLGVVDPATMQLTGVSNPVAFSSALTGAQSHLGSSLALLRANHVNPTVVAADYEIGRADQTGAASDRFDALGDYWDGYANSRVLAMLGGIAPAP